MADEDDQPLSELLQQVGNKAGWFDENGDISVSLENLSIRVKHGGKKKAKDKIATKAKTPAVSSKKPTKLMDLSEDDFESKKAHSSKKPKPSSFPFTSSEELLPTKPRPSLRKKSSEDNENQPPSTKKSTKKGKSGKKKAVMKKLVSFSSEDELSPELEIESVKPKTRYEKSTPVSRKQIKSTRKTPLGTPKAAIQENIPTTSTTQYMVEPNPTQTPTPSSSKKSQSSNEPPVAKHTPQNPTQKAASPRKGLYPNLDELVRNTNNRSNEPPVARCTPQHPTEKAPSPQKESLYPNLDELMKKAKPKPRISIGAKGYETIIHSPKHVKISRLSTNSNISSFDLPIAESTALDMEPSPSDSYLARPVFHALAEPQGSSGSAELHREGVENLPNSRKGKSTKPLTSQDLVLEQTLTQPNSAPGTKSSNSVPSSEYRGRSELTQVDWPHNDSLELISEEEGLKTVVSETTSEPKTSSQEPNVSGPQVIAESSLSSRPIDSSASLFSTKNQGSTSEQQTDKTTTDPSVGSLNLSSYIKGKKAKSKKKKKSIKQLLIEPDLSSDDDKLFDKDTLLEESRQMLESFGSDESELPFPLTQNHRGYAPNSQYSEDIIPPSRNYHGEVRVSETDSSTKVVPESECNFVPESQSVEVVGDSQETVGTQFECVPDSEAVSSPFVSTQPTQDTVIRVPTQQESSLDNATTMFIKARSKYVGEVDGSLSPRQGPIQSPTSDAKSNTKSAETNDAAAKEPSQNLSDVVSATKRKGKRNIPLELVESLDDPAELQATIELLSQKLETILSAKKTSGIKQKSMNLSERNKGEDPGSLFRLKQRDLVRVAESPQSPQRSFNELCINSKAQNVDDLEHQANVSLQSSLPTGAEAGTRCIALQASMMPEDTVEDTEERGTEEVVSPGQNEMCNVSLQCSMPTSPLTDTDRNMPGTEEEEVEDEENHDDVLYRTAMGDDLQALVEQEYLTEDESFEKETAAKTPSPPFHLKNAMSVERVKTILSDSKLRRRSTQVKAPRKVLSLDSHDSDKENPNIEEEDDELPDIPNAHRSTVTSWRTAPESCPSPESPRRQTDSSGEDDMETFFSKIRRPTPRKEPVLSMEEFIVDDDDLTSDGEDKELFHVRTDNTHKQQKPGLELSSDNEDDFDDTAFTSDDDDDVIEVEKKQDKPRNIPLFKTPSLPPLRKKPASSAPRADPTSRVTTSANDLMTTPVRPPPRVLPNTTGHAPTQYASFLRSLGPFDEGTREARHPDAAKYIKNFHKQKEELSARLFQLYNTTVFESKLPEDMEIKWNSRLLKTAGFCAYKRSTATHANRRVRIELSVKVCDSSERVRDTLIHEMCHAAVWVVHGVNDGHGPYWKHWAHKANRIHPDLPVIKRCHSYSIQTKYVYKCTSCGYEVGRHSKSLNTDTKVCGYCRSPFQLLVNSKQGKRNTPSTPSTPRTPNRFALFVKENYKTLKEQNQATNHKEVMALLSAEFAKTKVSN